MNDFSKINYVYFKITKRFYFHIFGYDNKSVKTCLIHFCCCIDIHKIIKMAELLFKQNQKLESKNFFLLRSMIEFILMIEV